MQKLSVKVYDLIDGSGFLNLSIVKIHCFQYWLYYKDGHKKPVQCSFKIKSFDAKNYNGMIKSIDDVYLF